MENITQDKNAEVETQKPDEARRDALKKMGAFAYAAPALMLLAQPKIAEAYGGKKKKKKVYKKKKNGGRKKGGSKKWW